MKSENSLPGYIVGIDEAGRGPLAGPVTVAAVAFIAPFDTSIFADIKDSKKLSEKRREHFRSLLEELVAGGVARAAVHSSSAQCIDEEGIVPAIRSALSRALYELSLNPTETLVKLDGSLKAPEEFIYQETIIRGDETELPITLAGILAKTTRDREMARLAVEFPEYGFEVHKGYGTKKHQEAIVLHGTCALHRMSFIHLTKS